MTLIRKGSYIGKPIICLMNIKDTMMIEKKVLSDILVGIGNTMIMKAQPIIKSRPWKPVTVTSVDSSPS